MNYLRHYTEQETSKALDKNGAFFAFGNKQFFEQREPGVKYVSMNGGLICPKENVKKLLLELDKAVEKGIKADVNENGFENIVRREYFNYETQISMDNQNVVAMLSDYIRLFPETFTVDAIIKECRKCFKIALKEDLF